MGMIIDTPDTEFRLEARRESFCVGAMEFDDSCKKTGKVFISHAQYGDKLDNGHEATIEATWSELDGLIDGLLRLRAHAAEQGVLPPPLTVNTDPADEADLDTYAMLLRHAWLNPSSKDAAAAVHAFERRHDVRLRLRHAQWQTRSYQVDDVQAAPKASPSIDSAIDAYSAAGTKAARADLRRAIDTYARGALGDLTDKIGEALGALTGRRLAGTTKLPAFVKMLQEQGRTDAQLEQLLSDVFEGIVMHLHERGDPDTMVHTCSTEDIGP